MHYKFSELVDIEIIQELTDSFYKTTDIPTAILGPDREVLVSSGWQDICVQFHRRNPKTELLCRERDTFLLEQLSSSVALPESGYIETQCKNGLIDIAVPIRVAGEQLAVLFFGQLLYESPDEAWFSRQARHHGFDEKNYLAALAKVPVLSREKVNDLLNYHIRFVHLLVEMGARKRSEIDAQKALRQNQALLQTVLDHTDNAILALDADYRVIYFNQQYLALYPFSPEFMAAGPTIQELIRQICKLGIYPVEQEQALLAQRLQQMQNPAPGMIIELPRQDGKVVECFAAKLPGGGYLQTFRDVTSDRLAKIALQRSEERLRTLIDVVPSFISVRNAEGRFLASNKAMAESFSMQADDLVGKLYTDVHPVSAIAAARQEDDRRVLESGEESLRIQEKWVDKTGATRWAQTTKVPCPESLFGEPALVVSSTDITQLKQAEASWHLDEARLEALLTLNQMAGAPIEEIINFIVTSAIRLTRSKIGYLALVDEHQGTLVKHGWARGVTQECRMKEKSAGYAIENAGLWAEAVRHRKPIIINDYAQPQLVKKGCPMHHAPIERFMGVPILDRDKVLAIIGVGNKEAKYNDADVRQLNLLGQGLAQLMESKRIEQGLRESQQKHKKLSKQFQALLDGIPDGIFLMTPDMQIVWGNQDAARSLGLEVDALSGQRCHSLWAGREEICVGCPVARCFSSGKAEEETTTTADGRTWGLKAFPLTNAAGQVENVIKMAVDITEKVKLRDEEERTSRLASLGELAAGVAHEINNPNGVLMLNSMILADLFAEILPVLPPFLQEQGIESLAGLDSCEMDEEIPQMLTDMQDSSKRINRIVKDLKQFVQSEFKTSFGLVDLKEVVDIALRLTGSTLKKFAPCYEVCHASALPKVKGVFQQLEQVVVNLIINASQALGDEKGNIFVATYFDETHGHCVVEVRDEGKGIDPKVLLHITEPFFTTKRQNGGTGLGLSVSARIVREHGGKLEFLSLPGQGTTVRLILPSVNEGELL